MASAGDANPFAAPSRGAAATAGPTSGAGATATVEAPKVVSAKDHLTMALAVTAETQDMGESTLTELERQRETLERVQRKVDNIEAHADESNYILKGMRSVFTSIGRAFSKKPDLPQDIVAKRAAERAAKREETEKGIADRAAARSGGSTPSAASAAAASGSSGSASGGAGTVSATKPKTAAEEAIAEEDAILAAISRNVDGIKRVGHAIGDELDRQDTLITDLTTSVDRTTAKVDVANSTARRLAR